MRKYSHLLTWLENFFGILDLTWLELKNPWLAHLWISQFFQTVKSRRGLAASAIPTDLVGYRSSLAGPVSIVGHNTSSIESRVFGFFPNTTFNWFRYEPIIEPKESDWIFHDITRPGIYWQGIWKKQIEFDHISKKNVGFRDNPILDLVLSSINIYFSIE
jgi:hypothetical protein